MVGMTTHSGYAARATLVDRVARWALEPDGDLYGDERERLRQYEAIAVAAGLQWLAVPWAAAVGVWWADRAAAVCLVAVMLVLLAPMLVAQAYLRRRRVDTTPRRWTAKRVALGVAGVLPWALFVAGAARALGAGPDTVRASAGGAVVGAALSLVLIRSRNRRRTAQEAAGAGAEDD